MQTFGVREWVGITGMAVAIGVAMSFCNPAAGQDTTKRPIELGQPVTADTSTPTPTPVPTLDLPSPGRWFVRYLTSGGVEDGYFYYETLDIAFAGAPLPDMTDDNWGVRATAEWNLPAARYGFTLEYDAQLQVANGAGEVLRDEPNPATASEARIVFDHAGGPLELTLTARDTGGPLRLAWR